MEKYYFKIKNDNTEVEFSSSDKAEFEKSFNKLYELIKMCENKNINLQKIKNSSGLHIEMQPDLSAKSISDIENTSDFADFEKVLQKSMNSLKEPKQPHLLCDEKVVSFLSTLKKTEMKDYLIAIIYYLCEYEKLCCCSLKQINKKLYPIKNKAIDHAILHETLKTGYIKIVPDLTGTSLVTEYALTEKGEEYFKNELL